MADLTEVKDPVTKAGREIPNEKLEEIALERFKWANRRRMAYHAMYFGFVLASAVLAGVLRSNNMADRIAKNETTVFWVMFFIFSTPMAYMGVTIADAVLSKYFSRGRDYDDHRHKEKEKAD